jgi:hypothetical protein
MIVTFTWVRKQPHLSNEAFLERWVEHTERFDLEDHPYITKNRLMLIQGETPYVGMAENHWPDLASLEKTEAFYRDTEAGRAHFEDLRTFMDIDQSPTVVVSHEADVSAAGTTLTRFLG